MILQDLRSIIKKCIYFDQRPEKWYTARNSTRLSGRKWLVKMLLVVFIIVFCIYIYRFKTIAKKIDTKNNTIKYILIWTQNDWFPFNTWKTGQEVFIEKRCLYCNCFVTNRRYFFGDDLTKFDVIAFNARNFNVTTDAFDIPKIRSPHQKYIFFNTESSDNIPICHPIYDGFFNWTATYKLNSDIVYSYIGIKNRKGEEIGPNIKMTWLDHNMSDDNTKIQSLNKTKAVAWFVSNCVTRSKREKYAKNLEIALKKHKLALDIYGGCGLKCDKCSELLHNYYFYLAFENSFAEDYVTEKLITPLWNSNVPIVFGGADYSRFLPPGSYLDARKHRPQDLAGIIAHLINTPAEYKKFFRWRSHYSYHEPDNVCRLCAALNNTTMLTHKMYKDIRGWWNPDYKKRCREFYSS